MKTKENLLTIQGISKHYGQQAALSDVTFSVSKGEICGLVGPNGAGKTTLLRILSGLIRQSGGEISVAHPPRIGALIESPSLYPNLSAYDNLRFAALQCGIDQVEERIQQVLGLVGLSDVDKKKKVKDFSLGMRQRMAIGLALIDFPDFLILDEPINGLDPAGIKEMREIIFNLRDRFGITVLISSHILSELEQVVDRYVIMNKGRVIQDLSKDDLKAAVAEKIYLSTSDNPLVLTSLEQQGVSGQIGGDFVKLPPVWSVQELIQHVLTLGVEIKAVYPAGQGFEDYYLNLVKEGN